MTNDSRTVRTDPSLRFDVESVRAALEVAVRAPSIHNTQPWRWRLDGDGLALFADRSRQLAVADPDGHSLLISCGATLYLAELALRAAGWQVQTSCLPDPADPDLLARLHPVGQGEPDDDLTAQAEAALRRRSDRRPFAEAQIGEQDRELLRAASSDSVAYVDFPDTPERHVQLAAAVSWADRIERNDEAYVAEMQRWLREPDVHATVDGIPAGVIPHVAAEERRHTDVPLRDFEVGITGGQLIKHDVDERPLIAVVFTHADAESDHLSAGVAMMRLMVQAELMGLATCPLSQAVDFAAFRARLQGRMGWIGFPQMMMRIGRPSTSTSELPATPRRPVTAVLDVAESG